MPDSGVRGLKFKLTMGSCLSRQPLRYSLGTGCTHLLQCLGTLSLIPSVGKYNEYKLLGHVIIINGDGGYEC